MGNTVEEISEAILESARHPFLILDSSLRIVTANPSFFGTFGVTLEEIIGKPLDKIGNGSPEILRLQEALRNLPQSGHSFDDIEVEIPLGGSRRRVLRFNGRVVAPNLGQGPHTVVSIEDITDRIEADRKLRESEIRYRRLFETAQDGILILDAEAGVIEQANPFIARLLGLEPEDLIGKEMWEIGFFRNKDAAQQAFRRLQDEGYIRFEDLPLHTRKGHAIEVEFVCNVYPVAGIPKIQCNIRDVSDRVRADRELRAAEARLRRSLKQEAVGTLAGGVAHEYNNLLTAINGFCSLCLSLPDPDGIYHGNLREILRAGERAAGLTRQLLAYSRRQVLKPKLVDPNSMVTHVRDMVGELVGNKIGLEAELDPSIGLVNADQGQIEQALFNLVLNAKEAMPEGGRLTLKTGHEEDYAVLSISDTGVGMDEKMQERIFDPFYSTRPMPGGPGLGLSMVEGIVAQSGGHVEAQSAPGQGSTFKVFLPIAREARPRTSSS